MDMQKVINYLNTASPEQVDAVRKHIGERKQAKLIHDEYQMALATLKREYQMAEQRLRTSLVNLEKDIQAKKEFYRTRAASVGLHWDKVEALTKARKKGLPRRWKVVTPIAADTRTFVYLKNANGYRKRMGGYLLNMRTGKTYFEVHVTRLLPS